MYPSSSWQLELLQHQSAMQPWFSDHPPYPVEYEYGGAHWESSFFQPYAEPMMPFPPYPFVARPVFSTHRYNKSRCISQEEVALRNEMRTLWEQHVAWTRMLIISIAHSLPDEELVTKRLLRNPTDMARVIAHYYGEENAAMFNKLFTNHLVLAAQLVKAAKAGNQQDAARYEKQWYQNADQIASFLHKLNPYWSEQEMRSLLYEHLALTKAQAVARLSNDFATDIATFDKIERQALEMADAFTDGIVQQFPQAFLG